MKARIDAIARRLPLVSDRLGDRLLQFASKLFGDHLPPRMREFRARYEHHLILKTGEACAEEARAYLAQRYPNDDGAFFECTDAEAAKAFLHRFAVAGAAVRYRAVHERDVEDIIALDVALRRNDEQWFEALPPETSTQLISKLYYGHFFCHVFHHDYIVMKGANPTELEHKMLQLLDERGAEYPAEHNVGHLYQAKKALIDHYRRLDPTNSFNPGIGNAPRGAYWRDGA